MIQTKAVKSTAIASLKGNWVWAIIAALVPACLCVISVIIQGVFSLITNQAFAVFLPLFLFVVFPVFLGSIRVFWKIANSEKQFILDVFYYFSNKQLYKRAVKFAIIVFLPLSIISSLCFLPATLLIAISKGAIFNSFRLAFPVLALFMGYLGQLFFIAAIIFLIVKVLNYYTAVFLFVVNDNTSPESCIKKSFELAKYTKSIYTSHIFGYAFWIVVSIFMLPLVFTAPYLIMSYVVDCRFCVSYYNRLSENTHSAPYYQC